VAVAAFGILFAARSRDEVERRFPLTASREAPYNHNIAIGLRASRS
jgi:hypothetical protein